MFADVNKKFLHLFVSLKAHNRRFRHRFVQSNRGLFHPCKYYYQRLMLPSKPPWPRPTHSLICRYSPDSDCWSTDVAPLSSPRSGVCLVAMDGYLYAAGGHDGFTAVNVVERYCRVCAFLVSAQHFHHYSSEKDSLRVKPLWWYHNLRSWGCLKQADWYIGYFQKEMLLKKSSQAEML